MRRRRLIASIVQLERQSRCHHWSRSGPWARFRRDLGVCRMQCGLLGYSVRVLYFGRIDININAAGIVYDQSFLTTTLGNMQKTFAVNVTGSVLIAQACANAMVERYKKQCGDIPAPHATGTIIFIASIATYMTSSAQQISCYTASKAAVKGLVKPVAMELSKYGIRVNSLSPGYTMTDMMRSLQSEQPDLVKQFEKETMFGRIGLPEELQGAILWLCSDRASGWYTGQDLLVDGGATSWKHPAVLG
ncbi:hypothetical protein MRB53_039654 [Persea americana]|nr:hypothetical protein MRB53_039654 [Persea americana]